MIKAIVGLNGSGKTRYVEKLIKEYTIRESHRAVKYLAFRDTYGAADAGYYLQQRFNSQDAEENPLSALSSGELRKYQLNKALSANPRVLIIDNPYIGLDAQSRQTLTEMLVSLKERGQEVIIVLASPDSIPSFVDEVVQIGEGISGNESFQDVLDRIESLPDDNASFDGDVVVGLDKVSITLGGRQILKDVDWTVRKGEKWALRGPNGSGKSTLLSIVCADIPQAYACDVTLFDRRRGTGESIWEIKKHIGYVSPELHRSCLQNVPVVDVVASGLHDRVGMYVRTAPEHFEAIDFWMDIFGVSHLRDRSFLKISSGEQRLVLLARAFVKDPELLILDEPLHGLDTLNRAKVKAVIDTFARRKGKTLIMVSHYDEELPDCITGTLTLERH